MKTLLTLLFTGVLMSAMDLAVIGPALPAIKAEFGMSDRELATLFNAYVLCAMLGTQLLAKMSDQVGPRAVYVGSIALFAAGSLVLVLAASPDALYLGRAIQGIGAGGIVPVASVVIGTRLPVEKRGPALGLLGAIYGIAFFIGPILGGILLRFSWHWLFIINLPIAALLAIGALRLLPTRSDKQRQPFDVGGAAVLAIGLIALVSGVNGLDTSAPLQSLREGAGLWLVLLVLAVPVFWRIEHRATDPLVRPSLFQSRQLVTTWILTAGIGALQSAGIFFPALAVAALGVSPADAALLLLPGVVASTLAAPLAGKLINHVGTRLVIVVSLALEAVALAMYGFLEITLPVFLAANIIKGIGSAGLLGAPLRFIVFAEAPVHERGASQGLLSVFTSIGRLIGAAVTGSVAASAGGGVIGYQEAFTGIAVLAVALFLVGLRLRSRTAELARQQQAEAA